MYILSPDQWRQQESYPVNPLLQDRSVFSIYLLPDENQFFLITNTMFNSLNDLNFSSPLVRATYIHIPSITLQDVSSVSIWCQGLNQGHNTSAWRPQLFVILLVLLVMEIPTSLKPIFITMMEVSVIVCTVMNEGLCTTDTNDCVSAVIIHCFDMRGRTQDAHVKLISSKKILEW